MDVESVRKWEDYSRAKVDMFFHTDTPKSRWFVVESDIKKNARLNMMSHLLSTIPYTDVPMEKVHIPAEPKGAMNYHRPPKDLSTYVPDHVAELMGDPEGKR